MAIPTPPDFNRYVYNDALHVESGATLRGRVVSDGEQASSGGGGYFGRSTLFRCKPTLLTTNKVCVDDRLRIDMTEFGEPETVEFAIERIGTLDGLEAELMLVRSDSCDG